MTDIDELELDARACNVLRLNNTNTIEHVRRLTDAQILRLPNAGRKTLARIREAVKAWDERNGHVARTALYNGNLDIFVSPDHKDPAIRLQVRNESGVDTWVNLTADAAIKVAHALLAKAIEVADKEDRTIDLEPGLKFRFGVDV